MRALVTVGSTQFDPLTRASLSPPVIDALRSKGYTQLVVQCGNYTGLSELDIPTVDEGWSFEREDVHIEVWRYKPTLQQEFTSADLVISHAGAGTITEVLRMGKPLIVVPNPTLLHNHQEDLASELDKMGYLKASTTNTLANDILDLIPSQLRPFPPMDRTKFRDLLDEEMGFL